MYEYALRKDSDVDFTVMLDASILWNYVHGMDSYLGYITWMHMVVP